MAILITNDGDKTVANIGARDALTRKFDGMNVTVLDAIADTSVGGGGVAGYQWSSALTRWMLMYKENKDNLTFLRENLVITNGVVTSQYAPASGLVWDCVIIDGTGLIVADVIPTITGTNISVDSSAYNGLYLNFTYAYGIAEAAAGIITKSSIGLGNVDNTSDLAKPISTATQTALNLKSDIATTYTKTETIAAISLYAPAPVVHTTLAGYGITDAYTIAQTDAAIAAGGGGGGSISVADDIATVATYYPTFATVTAGTLSTIKTSSTRLTYTPSTGTLFATNFSSSSDLNLKDHISTVVNGLNVIDSLNPVSFKWKESGAASFGVIAQELELVVPELVSTSADTGYKAVNYDGLIAFLISAVKDLSQQVAELKAK